MSQANECTAIIRETRTEPASWMRLAEGKGRTESLRPARADFVKFSVAWAEGTAAQACGAYSPPADDNVALAFPAAAPAVEYY